MGKDKSDRALKGKRKKKLSLPQSCLRLFRQLQAVADRENNLETFLEETARILGLAFGHSRVTIFLYDESSQELYFLKGWKTEKVDFPLGYRQKVNLGLMGKAIRLRQPIVVNDVHKDPDYLAVPGVKVGSEACFPIIFRREVLGLLDVHDSREKAIKQGEVNFLNFLTRFIGSALAERRKEEELTSQLEKTRVILDGIKDGYYEVDLKGNFIFINEALARTWGRNRKELLGGNYGNFLESESIDRVFRIFNQVYNTGKAQGGIEIQVRDIKGTIHTVELSVALKKDAAGAPIGFYGIVHDITERVRIENELRQANARFSSLLEALPEVIYFKDLEGRNLIINRAMEEMTGLKREEILGKTDSEIFPPDLAAQCLESDQKVLTEKKIFKFFEKTVRPDGQSRYFETIKAPVFDIAGNITGIVGVSRDITEKKLAELALAEQKELLQIVLDSAEDLIFVLDRDYQILLFNKVGERFFGLSQKELKGKKFNEIYPAEGWPEAKNRFDRVFEGEVIKEDVEINYRGRNFILSVTEVPLRKENGEVYAVCGVARDVTQRAELERELQSSLREKEVLLREIHHRVKNNMQVISSLLNLQAHYVNNPEFTSIIKECQNRIRSMALVHEHLYKSKNLASINFADYLAKLIIHLYNVHQIKQEKIELEIETDDLFLEIGVAIPLGLMASEIISNSFKHAFPGERKGKVRVRLKEISPSHYQLEISDNGVGLPPEVNPVDSKSFGLQLVSLLSDQIGAKIEVDRQAGTRFVVAFEYEGSSLKHNSW
jgi:PAS domain S-box-containing protein